MMKCKKKKKKEYEAIFIDKLLFIDHALVILVVVSVLVDCTADGPTSISTRLSLPIMFRNQSVSVAARVYINLSVEEPSATIDVRAERVVLYFILTQVIWFKK